MIAKISKPLSASGHCGWAGRMGLIDVLVIGAGHAGCEAAAAASRMGCRRVALVTHDKRTIGAMSCNPSFGGIGKGQLMREVDALDGLCARVADASGISFRVLNRRKGPAVLGLRAQIDRSLYAREMQREILERTPNLSVVTGEVDDLVLCADSGRLQGVQLKDGSTLHAKTVVIATGTFLGAELFRGLETWPGGRLNEKSSHGLSARFKSLGFRLLRLRTGTPPRLLKRTVDTGAMSFHPPDDPPVPFSFMNERVWIEPADQLLCYITHTNERVAEVCRQNMHENAHVKEEVSGPRYCPSLESKVIKFGKARHQIWLEPEGLSSELYYPQGIAMTFAAEVQQRIINCIPGLENAKVVTPGYGVHYDCVDPRQLRPTLEVKEIPGLFLAGQINGSTGYEEAAAQGILAGAHAAGRALGSCDTETGALADLDCALDRTRSYLGVMVDDLTSLGVTEPYRMFTARAEFRAFLRPDNADVRLTAAGHRCGLVGRRRYEAFARMHDRLESMRQAAESTQMPLCRWREVLRKVEGGEHLLETVGDDNRLRSALDLLGAHDVPAEALSQVDADAFPPQLWAADAAPLNYGGPKCVDRLRVDRLYEHVLRDARAHMAAVRRAAAVRLPVDLDYDSLPQLSFEARQALRAHRPSTLAAMGRVPGVTASDLVCVHHWIRRTDAASAKSQRAVSTA